MDTVGLMTATGIGLLIGLVRERSHSSDAHAAGVRTHALAALAELAELAELAAAIAAGFGTPVDDAARRRRSLPWRSIPGASSFRPALGPAGAAPVRYRGGAGIVLLLSGANGLRQALRTDRAQGDTLPRAFRLSHAVLLGALMAALLLVSAWLREWLGDSGAVAAAVLVALWGLVALWCASCIAKSGLAFAAGGLAYGRGVALGIAASAAVAAGATVFAGVG